MYNNKINNKYKFYKYVYNYISIIIMYYILYITLIYNNNNIELQFRKIINILNIKILIGIDGINISLIILISIITPILIFIREKYNKENKNYQLILIIIEII